MIVKEDIRAKAGLVYNVVESVILAMSVGLMVWLANLVIEQGKTISAHSTMISINSGRLDTLEMRGSRSLETHVKDDDSRITDLRSRVEKLEGAVLALATVPIKIDNMTDSQKRIERMLEDHLRMSK